MTVHAAQYTSWARYERTLAGSNFLPVARHRRWYQRKDPHDSIRSANCRAELLAVSTYFEYNFQNQMRILFSVVTILVLSSSAHADRRSFTRTYEYTTTPEGQTELEIYSTQSRNRFTDASPRSFELQLEIEHGITDRFDLGLYHVFKQVSSDDPATAQSLQFSDLLLEARYRFAERGELPVDIVAYAELGKEFGAGVYEAETKAILARDFDRVVVAANLIAEVEFGPDVAETELELGWSVGAALEVSPSWRFGAESYGSFEAEEPGEVAAYAGPTIGWAPRGKLWVAGTAGFGLNDEADRFSGRFILGINL